MGRMYARDWRGRFASTGSVRAHGSRRMRKQGQVKALTRRNGRNSVSVIQRDRSGRNRVRQTTVRRPYSRLPLARRRAIRVSAAATSVPLRKGQSRLVVKGRRGQTRIPRRNVYVTTADT